MEVKTLFAGFYSENSYATEAGDSLQNITLAFQTYGSLNKNKDNVILICHALTGNAHAAGILPESELENGNGSECLMKYNKMFMGKPGWWDPLIGPGKTFDTDKYFVICINIPGSCYGSAGPAEINKDTGEKYGIEFPLLTVRDVVRLQKELLDFLGITRIQIAAGGSLGGMQVLEMAIMFPEFIDTIIPVATSAGHSDWAVGLNSVQRQAIMADPEWKNGNYKKQPENGISIARQVAMISYRSAPSFERKFGRELKKENFYSFDRKYQAENYLEYQGKKLCDRFDANTYLYLSHMMDMHDVGKNRGGIDKALGKIKSRSLVIGISSDILYPPEEQKKINSLIPGSKYAEINSIHGHDAFLIEYDQMEEIIKSFIEG